MLWIHQLRNCMSCQIPTESDTSHCCTIKYGWGSSSRSFHIRDACSFCKFNGCYVRNIGLSAFYLLVDICQMVGVQMSTYDSVRFSPMMNSSMAMCPPSWNINNPEQVTSYLQDSSIFICMMFLTFGLLQSPAFHA